MKVQEAIKTRGPSIGVALISMAAMFGIEVTEMETNAVVEGLLKATAGLAGAYAAVRVLLDKFVGKG